MQNITLSKINYRASIILDIINESLAQELKALHARNAATGFLKSGATIKESKRIARASIKKYFSELEKFVHQCPNGSCGSDSEIINIISPITNSLIKIINQQLIMTASLAVDADLIKHIQPEILKELSASQEIFRSILKVNWIKSSAAKSHLHQDRFVFIAEIACFILTLGFTILWVRNPTENYESLTMLFGLGLGLVAAELFRRYTNKHKT